MNEKWVKEILEKYPTARRDVLEFISRAIYQPNSENLEYEHTIEHHYAAGYCYYFAVMLQLNFGGAIKWLKNRSHIVWEDTFTHIVYDCHGVFDDYGPEELVPVTLLGECIELFKHGVEYSWSDEDIKQKQLDLQKRINTFEEANGHELTHFYENYYKWRQNPSFEEVSPK